jgi:beta-lactamase class D
MITQRFSRLLAGLCLSLSCLAPGAVSAASSPVPFAVAERPDWERYFTQAGVTGTLVILEDGSRAAQVYDAARAATGFLPASTFKIPNSLIALETGVVSGPDTVFPWDGRKRFLDAWNRDLTLAEALRVSCVPVYQELARRIGQERMQWWVKALDYGNADIGEALDTFWLEGRLRISALEQVAFLQRLANGGLPLSQRTMDAVRDMLVEERAGAGVLRAKTGLTARESPNVGWWVGWVEKGGKRWFFALNIDSARLEDLEARKNVVKAVLAAEGMWP